MAKKRERREYFARYRKENPEIRKVQAERKRQRYRARGLTSDGKIWTMHGLMKGTALPGYRQFLRSYSKATRQDFFRYAAASHCESCRVAFAKGRHRKCQDHCHVTGKLRGVICHVCNIAQGCLNCVENARAMVAYFERHGIIAQEHEPSRPEPADSEPSLFDSPSSPPAPPLAPP